MDSSPRLLIVDDNVGNLSMYADFFRNIGYRVDTASDGRSGLDAMAKEKPRVALVDVQMPGMDGLQFVGHVRSMPEVAGIPVIALTALGMPGDEQRCLAAGFDRYLCKPVSLRKLAESVAECVENGRACASTVA